MQFNSLIFPSPAATYTHSSLFGSVLYIPKDTTQWEITAPFVSATQAASLKKHEAALSQQGAYNSDCIPCLFLPSRFPTNKILLHFHGNAEDINLTADLLKLLRVSLNIHVIAMEYKGYGIYNGSTNSDSILQDAETVFSYLTSALNFAPEEIIVFGRSIGSGPACYLASKYHVHSLILMSAFTSLRDVVRGLVGPILQYAVADRFNNKTWLKSVTSPVFLMHGQKDEIVSLEQAKQLHAAITTKCKLHTPPDMDHNSFSFMDDFIYPLIEFYEEAGLDMHYKVTDPASISRTDTCSQSSDVDDGIKAEKGKLYIPIKAFNKPMLKSS